MEPFVKSFSTRKRIRNLACQVPSGHIAGQKPPVSEQLPDDKGILITGCQAHET